MGRPATAVLASLALMAGCGTVLGIDEDPPSAGGPDAGYTRLPDGALVGPDGEILSPDGGQPTVDGATDGSAGADADAAGVDSGAAQCLKPSACTGTVLASNTFASLATTGWVAYPNRLPTLDTGDFTSTPSSLRTAIDAEGMANGGSVSWLRNGPLVNHTKICAEACIKLDVPTAFGPGADDAVTFLFVESVAAGAMTQNASLRVATADDVRTENTAYPLAGGGFPRGAWFFAKLELDYLGLTVNLSVNGALKASGNLRARPTTPSSVMVYVGVLASGAHGAVVAHHDDFRLTQPP